jgi:hypothetical protein
MRALAPPVGFIAGSCTPPPPHPHPRTCVSGAAPPPGVVGEIDVGEPAAGCIPSVPPVGGWGRIGASSWPQIRRWDRRWCC